MALKPTIEQLEEGSVYEKVLTLSYGDIAPFVIGSLKSVNLPMIILWITLACSAFLIAWLWPNLRCTMEHPQIVKGLTTGLLALPLLMVPVHEGLHLISYRLAGARDIRYGADLRQGIIYVTAHRFVTGRRLFSIVAFAPLVIVTAGIVVLMIFCSPWWQWVLSLALFTHTTMCAGDTALIGFMMGLKSGNVYTWDDADRKEAYFYAEKMNVNDHL
jgi:hypothetical protein